MSRLQEPVLTEWKHHALELAREKQSLVKKSFVQLLMEKETF